MVQQILLAPNCYTFVYMSIIALYANKFVVDKKNKNKKMIYGVAIYGRRINSDGKKLLFLRKIYECPREKFSKRKTYSLDPFYQH